MEREFFASCAEAGGHRWPLVRIAAGGETRVVVLCHKFLALTVHWVGKSIPCGRDGCGLCQWLPQRGLYYLAVACGGRPSMLELSAISSSHLEQHCKLLHGGLRAGLEIRLSRRTAKSPVHAEVVDVHSGVRSVDEITIASRVAALYQLPPANPGEGIEPYSERLLAITRRRVARLTSDLEKRSQDAMNGRGAR